MTLRTLNYGNYGIFLIMGNAGFCPSAVWAKTIFPGIQDLEREPQATTTSLHHRVFLLLLLLSILPATDQGPQTLVPLTQTAPKLWFP